MASDGNVVTVSLSHSITFDRLECANAFGRRNECAVVTVGDELKHANDAPALLAKTANQDAKVNAPKRKKARKTTSEVYPDPAWVPLTFEQAERRLRHYGSNTIKVAQPPTWYRVLFLSVAHPFNLILTVLAVAAAIIAKVQQVTHGDEPNYSTTIIMLVMVVLSTSIRFVQEWKSNVAAESLKTLVKLHVRVIRVKSDWAQSETDVHDYLTNSEHVVEIALTDVVPGDIVRLAAGDIIPGDSLLLASKDLFISQSSLTGESLPVQKNVKTTASQIPNTGVLTDFLDESDVAFLGTHVISGMGVACVLRTGNSTLFGSLAKELAKKRPRDAFQKGIIRLCIMFVVIISITAPITLILNGVLNHDWISAVFFAVSVAVGLTPEMLPMVLQANVSLGALFLSKKRCIVKRLDAVVNLGAMDTLCTDKTGTLTMDKVALVKHVDLLGNVASMPLSLGHINAVLQTGMKNLLDEAIIRFAEDRGACDECSQFEKLDEIPFDFQRRRVSVVVINRNSERQMVICKGAVEEVMSVCSSVWLKCDEATMSEPNVSLDDLFQPLTDERRETAKQLNEQLSQDGLRVLAVAFKTVSGDLSESNDDAPEQNLVFAGFLAFIDPPKESAAVAIRSLIEHGVRIKVLTGDNDLVCQKVCKDIGLPVEHVVKSSDLRAVTDAKQFAQLVDRTTIFAKLDPMQKAEVIRALKAQNKVVGFLGDGINDSLALHEADVGVSVDTGADAAKEVADVILLEKDLTVIDEGVLRGRITYANTLKYIKMAISSNFGNVVSVLVASAWLPFLPIQPVQLLVQNLLYDFSQIAIPWDNVDKDYLLLPHRWNARGIIKFMVVMGPLSSIFDIILFITMWFYFGWQTKETEAYWNTCWFTQGLITQTLIVHMIRSPKLAFVRTIASPQLLCGTIITAAVGIVLPYIPGLNNVLLMLQPPGIFYAFMVGNLIGYALLTQAVKMVYIKILKEWI